METDRTPLRRSGGGSAWSKERSKAAERSAERDRQQRIQAETEALHLAAAERDAAYHAVAARGERHSDRAELHHQRVETTGACTINRPLITMHG